MKLYRLARFFTEATNFTEAVASYLHVATALPVNSVSVTTPAKKAGASIPPETMMNLPPCFRFPPLSSKTFQTLWKMFQILPFPEKFLDFHPSKFLMTFLVIDLKFGMSPLFPQDLFHKSSF